ncbi:MAG: BatA domain-containing protein [Rubripirellula sp.]
MSFLQPAMLLALPAIAIPIIIHLINQRRFQTVNWAAMQFLLAANRMSRGYARIRQWLILAARTLAVAGLLLAIARPLSSGLLGLAGGGRVDTTIVLLDRSPSMLQAGPGGITKLQAGINQLTQSLGVLKSNRYILIDSVTAQPIEIESVEDLSDLPEVSAVSQSSDLPAMLETVEEYIRANRPSRCEVWICSDVRKNDWKEDSGRWQAIRSSLQELPQMVRFHLLAYPELDPQNRSLRVTAAQRVEGTEGAQLQLSLRIEQREPAEARTAIPIQLELDGARSEFTVEMTGTELELQNHIVPLDGGQNRGWGKLSIPSDASPADNEYYFVYDDPIDQQTLIVAEDLESVRPLEFAAGVAPDEETVCTSVTVTPEQLIGTSMEEISLLLWQSAIPETDSPSRAIIDGFLARGGRVIFFPPSVPTATSFAGVRWTDWQAAESETPSIAVTTWVADQGLLAKTLSGAALPVGELKVARYCELEGQRTALASLDGGAPLLARALTDQRNVFFCSTTTSATDSTLAANGIVLYAMLHRALTDGAQSLGNTRQFIAGDVPVPNTGGWSQLAGDPQTLSNAYAQQAGVYTSEEQLFAINRGETEDSATILADDRVTGLFEGLDFDRVDDRAGNSASLIQEIWRLFLILMLIALVLEAALCIPRRVVAAPEVRL